jgi:inositol-phosphate phosphatase/L-galactose 1-phosphate phosphatase
MASFERELAVAVDAARRAGAEILAAWPRSGARSTSAEVEYKGAVDLVTETDKKCEDIVIGALVEAFPDDDVVGEETHGMSGEAEVKRTMSSRCWYVDPLDGTTNFVHGYPWSCVSVGLRAGGAPAVGVVFNPVMNEMFTAVRGGGARLNGEVIRCSETEALGRSLIGTEIGVHRDAATVDAVMGRVRALVEHSRSVRCSGSCAMNMCGVAMGRLDGFFEIGFGGPWDCVAGAVIVREAGGVVVDPSGGEFDPYARRVLCANAHIGADFVQCLRAIPDGPGEPQKPR